MSMPSSQELPQGYLGGPTPRDYLGYRAQSHYYYSNQYPGHYSPALKQEQTSHPSHYSSQEQAYRSYSPMVSDPMADTNLNRDYGGPERTPDRSSQYAAKHRDGRFGRPQYPGYPHLNQAYHSQPSETTAAHGPQSQPLISPSQQHSQYAGHHRPMPHVSSGHPSATQMPHIISPVNNVLPMVSNRSQEHTARHTQQPSPNQYHHLSNGEVDSQNPLASPRQPEIQSPMTSPAQPSIPNQEEAGGPESDDEAEVPSDVMNQDMRGGEGKELVPTQTDNPSNHQLTGEQSRTESSQNQERSRNLSGNGATTEHQPNSPVIQDGDRNQEPPQLHVICPQPSLKDEADNSTHLSSPAQVQDSSEPQNTGEDGDSGDTSIDSTTGEGPSAFTIAPQSPPASPKLDDKHSQSGGDMNDLEAGRNLHGASPRPDSASNHRDASPSAQEHLDAGKGSPRSADFRLDGPPPSFDDLRRSLSSDETSLAFASPPRPDPSAFTPRPSPARSDTSRSSSAPSTPSQQRPLFSGLAGPALLTGALPGLMGEAGGALLPGDVSAKDLFFCHLCSYVGTSKYHFNMHMNGHFEHRCPHCDYTSRTEGRLKRHIKDFHTDNPQENFAAGANDKAGGIPGRTPGRPKMFRCKQCDFVAEEKVDFWAHTRTHIKEDKILQCPKCPFVTEYKHHLEYHLRNHFGSKPFKCPKCNYACVNKSMLNSHMKSHTNVYQYRCADCTYATKYCHSLKLHLRKYNHNPATVLNPDGSLPTDGSGDFELVSKRGPPRGPRGPKKDGGPTVPGGMKPMMLPPGMGGPLNGGMLGPVPGFWPMIGQLPPPPLIPVSAMGLGLPLLNGAWPEGSPLKCFLCQFTGEDRAALDQHMLKVHCPENQDLFHAFGMRPDSMMEENGKAINASWPFSKLPVTQSLSPRPGDDYEVDREPDSQVLMPPEEARDGLSEGRLNGEHPLDLTKRKGELDNYGREHNGPLDFSPGSKRMCPSDDVDSPGQDQSSGSPTPRKRSRKGKAYKLDTICMKLQERYGPDSPSQAEEYDSDEVDDYSPGKADEEYLRPECNGNQNGESSQFEGSLQQLNRSVDNMLAKYAGDTSTREAPTSPDSATPASLDGGISSGMNRRKLLMMRHVEDQALQDKCQEASEMQPRPDGSYECQHCAILFKDCILYTMHMGYHGYQDPFKCNMCGQQAKDRIEFFLHIARAAHD